MFAQRSSTRSTAGEDRAISPLELTINCAAPPTSDFGLRPSGDIAPKEISL
jgi:hypothetical protein